MRHYLIGALSIQSKHSAFQGNHSLISSQFRPFLSDSIYIFKKESIIIPFAEENNTVVRMAKYDGNIDNDLQLHETDEHPAVVELLFWLLIPVRQWYQTDGAQSYD